MKVKYLLAMDCDEQGYWDTSGYCHWRKNAYHRREEFDFDDEEGLTKAIACFIEEYPQGDYEIYVIQSYREWNEDKFELEQDDEHERKIANIGQKAKSLAQKIKEEKRLKEKEEENKRIIAESKRIKEQDLKKLEELKAKYEQGN